MMTSCRSTDHHSVEVEVLRSLRVVATLVLELGTVVHQLHHLRLELCVCGGGGVCVYVCVCVSVSVYVCVCMRVCTV